MTTNAPGLPIEAPKQQTDQPLKRWSIDKALNVLSQSKAIKIDGKRITHNGQLSKTQCGAKDYLCRHNGFYAVRAKENTSSAVAA